MGKYKFVYYYTFEEVIDFLKEKYEKETVIEALKAGITDYGLDIPLYPFSTGSSSEPTISLVSLVYGEYKDWYVETSDTALINDEIAESFLRRFVNIYASSYDKYKVLYDFYTSKKAGLMNDIERINQVKYNDTPQNQSLTDFSDDNHVSTLTTTTDKDPVETLIKRLDEISRLYENVLKSWSEKFRKLFWTEVL